jgi:hypothetical protein
MSNSSFNENGGTTSIAPRGLGDTVARVIRAAGLDKLAEAYTTVTGKDCGCEKRREDWNKRFPYDISGKGE